jgi:hypothetical protein
MLLLPAASAQSQPQSQSLGDYARSARKDKPQVAPARKFDNDNLPMNDKLSIVGKAPDSDQASEADQSAATDNAKTADKTADNAKSTAEAQADAPPPPPGTDPESLGKPAVVQPATNSQAGAGDGSKSDSAKSDQAKNDSADASKSDSSSAKKDDSKKSNAEEQQKAYEQWQKKIADQKDKVDLIARDLDVTQREYHLRAAAFVADAGNRLRNAGTWDQEDAKYKLQIDEKQKELSSAKQQLEDMQEAARKDGVPSSMRE